MTWETVIGLEVHVQLKTRSKMFCSCERDYFDTPPNTHVCPVCLGAPGVLPVINREAVRFTILAGLAMGCEIPVESKFDRKNYPYPDLMKGYQISQFDAPIGHGGWLNIEVDGNTRKIGITRVHLEEDVAKLLHRTPKNGESYSLVDVNRSGVPLMEIVGEPDLRSPEEARQYLIKLRSILQYLGVSTGNMEEGSFRCDANISLLPEGSKEYTAKVEVKNLNSFKAVYLAMEYEAQRQRKAAAEGKKLVQETRGWVEEKGETVSQRSKEYAHDYRYFPDPDLLPVEIDDAYIEAVRATLPELPDAKRQRFIDEYAIKVSDAEVLTVSQALADYFEAVADATTATPQVAANWVIGDLSGLLNKEGLEIGESRITAESLAGLIDRITDNAISGKIAKEVFDAMWAGEGSADEIIESRGLKQITDSGATEDIVDAVIAANPSQVAEYRSSKDKLIGYFVGQVMKETGGKANPGQVNQILKDKLK